MNRAVHGLIGVVLAPALIAVALSGVLLAWRPLSAPLPPQGTLAGLLGQIAAMEDVTEIDRLERGPDGVMRLHHYQNGTLHTERIGPEGRQADMTEGPVQNTAQTLHRELFAGRAGRMVVGVMAGAMAVLGATGLRLILRRVGGWRGLLAPAQGAGAGRLHALAGQLCLVPLMVLGATGLWMSLETFDLIDSALPRLSGLPDSSKVEVIPPPASLPVFDRPVTDMRALTFPFAGDWFDVFVLQTGAERLIVDQGTGAILERRPLPMAYRVSQWMYRLHTGAGLRLWAGVMSLAALAVPIFATTGALLWARRQRRGGGGATVGDMTIFVGSENGSTWDFARALAEAFRSTGQAVGLADLNSLKAKSDVVQTALILTSTYGNGVGPQNGAGAVRDIPQIIQPLRYAVLGFGDRQFPDYCAYADAVDAALRQGPHERLMPLQKINQQSRQVFSDWVSQLGPVLGLNLPAPQIKRADKPRQMVLNEIQHFRDAKGVTALLRFRPNRRLRFKPGDLVEISPNQDLAPRAYSIASPPGGESLDLLVREHENGLMSPQLAQLQPGQVVGMLHKRSSFRLPVSGPVIMIATGTGVAPFISMISAAGGRALSLYWGLRHDAQGYPFREALTGWQEAGHLHFYPAFSSAHHRRHVPDLLRAHGAQIRADLLAGGTTLICGSRHAARDIRAVLSEILSGSGTTLEDLKRQKRHLEDVY